MMGGRPELGKGGPINHEVASKMMVAYYIKCIARHAPGAAIARCEADLPLSGAYKPIALPFSRAGGEVRNVPERGK